MTASACGITKLAKRKWNFKLSLKEIPKLSLGIFFSQVWVFSQV